MPVLFSVDKGRGDCSTTVVLTQDEDIVYICHTRSRGYTVSPFTFVNALTSTGCGIVLIALFIVNAANNIARNIIMITYAKNN